MFVTEWKAVVNAAIVEEGSLHHLNSRLYPWNFKSALRQVLISIPMALNLVNSPLVDVAAQTTKRLQSFISSIVCFEQINYVLIRPESKSVLGRLEPSISCVRISFDPFFRSLGLAHLWTQPIYS
jgi:hypothetical protein